jgi:hypothetical protein
MVNAKKRDYDVNYIRTKCKAVKLLLNKEKDKDIILFLESKTNVNGYLKSLIRQDMSK